MIEVDYLRPVEIITDADYLPLPEDKSVICKECGAESPRRTRKQTFCGMACYADWNRKTPRVKRGAPRARAKLRLALASYE